MTQACIIGVGGYSGAGKTTLIERALPELKRCGLVVAVLKHAHHRLASDQEGKDSERFYRAGADYVIAHDSGQGFLRFSSTAAGLNDAVAKFPRGLDLILVEGHKEAGIPRIWLEKGRSRRGISTAEPYTLYRGDLQYLERFIALVHELLDAWHWRLQVRAGLLIGGRSRRMGRSKGLLRAGGKTLMERSFSALSAVAGEAALLGSAELPAPLKHAARLPDAPGASGPLAGMLAAFRWAPDSAWIIGAVDMPFMSASAWRWLRDQRKPGAWAVMPRLSSTEKVETTAALYEPMIFGYVESLARKGVTALQAIGDHPKVIKPLIPPELAPQWRNINTMEQWKRSLRELRGRG